MYSDPMLEQVVRDVVLEILRGRGASLPPAREASATGHGVFTCPQAAIEAAVEAQRQFARRSLADRAAAVAAIRRVCLDQADELGREELEETKIGRLEHKIEKLKVAAEKTPGVEYLQAQIASGSHGWAVTEFAPFGVIGIITPVTHSLPTLAGNAINLLAGGNGLVCNPHPSGARIACKGVRLFNQAIEKAIGIGNLLTILSEPTLETAQAIFEHRGVPLLCVTGGPAVARAALKSSKKAIVAGPGNPPVVVDETADLNAAARHIIRGAAYDNNLLCIAEKEIFIVESVFAEFVQALKAAGAVELNRGQVERLTAAAFQPAEGDKKKLIVRKELLGQDAAVLANAAGMNVPAATELLFGETAADHPFVQIEQMMPFVPLVRVRDVDEAIRQAKAAEHGYRHTAILHSRNTDTIARMSRELDTTLFVVNAPCMAALGLDGEGTLSFSIATPTGEGVTNPLTFLRQRRVSLGGFRVM